MIGWPPRFCAACGGRLSVVMIEGRRRRRCAACGWTFYGNPVPAAVGVISRGGRTLLTRRALPPYEGTWDLPGGFLEAGETPEAALRRELREELGVGTRRARLIGCVTDVYGPKGFPALSMVYRVMPASARFRPADDVREARWFADHRIPFREIAFPAMRQALRDYLSSKRKARRRISARRR